MDQNWQAPNGSLTVAVTGGNSLTGKMLLQRLKGTNARVIALVRSPVELAAEQVISNWVSSSTAMQAMQNADIVVHLSGELFARGANPYYAANVQTTKVVAQALHKGRAKRVLFLSYVGADVNSANLYLRTKGQAEQLLLKSGKAIVFRCPAIINSSGEPGPVEQALQAPEGGKVRALGNGRQRSRPIYRGDVVEALLAAMEHGAPGIYDLAGPEELTLDDLIRLINCDPEVAIAHTPAWLAQILSLFIPDLSPTFVDVMLHHTQSGPPSKAVAEFGLNLTSLHTLWRA